jgi:hypothetical protein
MVLGKSHRKSGTSRVNGGLSVGHPIVKTGLYLKHILFLGQSVTHHDEIKSFFDGILLVGNVLCQEVNGIGNGLQLHKLQHDVLKLIIANLIQICLDI